MKTIGRILFSLSSWLILCYLMLPLVVVIGASLTSSGFLSFPPEGLSGQWYVKFLQDPSYVSAIVLSMSLAALSTILSLALGVPASLVLARKDFFGAKFLSTLFLSPLILPGIVIGAGLLQYASALGFARTYAVILIGHMVVVIPYVIRSTLASLVRFPVSLEEAARDLGAGPFCAFFKVTLPTIKPGIIAGGLFAFIMSWINVEVTIFNATANLTTVPVKLFNYIQYSIDPMIAAVSAATIYVAIVVVVLLDLTVGIERSMISDK